MRVSGDVFAQTRRDMNVSRLRSIAESAIDLILASPNGEEIIDLILVSPLGETVDGETWDELIDPSFWQKDCDGVSM